MKCMKCGRDTADEQVFCQKCLEEMEKYPVRPGTVILLPRRRNEPAAKKATPRRKQTLPLEEQVRNLKRSVRRLVVTVVLLLILLGISGYFAVIHLLETETVLLPGQNYSTIMDIVPSGGE